MTTRSASLQRPNILLLYTDQQRWDALGAAGNPDIHTPNLDQLASEGTRFSHCFVQSPVCMPSRASFLSGLYPDTLGISHMGVLLPEHVRLLPHSLKSYGYRTANIGKLHALPHANRDHRNVHPPYGFDQVEISDEPGPYEDAYRAWVRARAPQYLDAVSVGLPPAAITWRQTMGIADGINHPDERFPKGAVPFPAPEWLTHSAFVAERTRAFINQQHNAPWLCISGFYSPHSPWVVPQRFLDLYDPTAITLPSHTTRRRFQSAADNQASAESAGPDDELRSVTHGYYAMVSEVDHYVGQIIDHLASRDMADNTLIIFTSDHGEWLGKYGRYGKGHPADDAVSRVPLLMRLPTTSEAFEPVVSTIVEAIDVLPTILEAAMIPVSPALQGTSLYPLMHSQPSDHTDSALTEHHGWKTLRTRHYRYLIEASGRDYLFHLDSDPDEQDNVVHHADHTPALAQHRKLLLQRLLARERPLARTWTY